MDKMKRKSRREKTVKELILRDDEPLQLTTAVEGPLGYENSNDYRLSVGSDGGLIVEKMIPGGWRSFCSFVLASFLSAERLIQVSSLTGEAFG
jgi:hypothetical protein